MLLQKIPVILTDPDLRDIGEQVGNPKAAKIMRDGQGRWVFSSAEEAVTAILALDGALIGLDGDLFSDATISACQWNNAMEDPPLCELCSVESDETGEPGI